MNKSLSNLVGALVVALLMAICLGALAAPARAAKVDSDSVKREVTAYANSTVCAIQCQSPSQAFLVADFTVAPGWSVARFLLPARLRLPLAASNTFDRFRFTQQARSAPGLIAIWRAGRVLRI